MDAIFPSHWGLIFPLDEYINFFKNDSIGIEEKAVEKRRSTTVDVSRLTKTYFSKPQNPKIQSNNIHLAVSTWECSKDYERILKLIGRNRRTLTITFDDLRQKGVIINAAKIKEVIGGLLSQEGIQLTEEQWECMYKFAEKDGQVNYKFMLEIFKERVYLLSAHPKKDIDTL